MQGWVNPLFKHVSTFASGASFWLPLKLERSKRTRVWCKQTLSSYEAGSDPNAGAQHQHTLARSHQLAEALALAAATLAPAEAAQALRQVQAKREALLLRALGP